MKAMAQKSWAKGEKLELTEMPDPPPRPEQIRVRVKAIGVNPVDWKMRSQGPLRLAAQLIGPPPPVIVGIDFAGIVDAVGADISKIKIGDAVVGGTDFSKNQHGSYADTVVVEPNQVAVLPKGFDLETAGAIPVAGVTAYMCLHEYAETLPGDRVLVIGASGAVGQIAIQMAKAAGATAVGICSGKNVDFVASLGADEVIDYNAGDPQEAARAFGPYKVIVDCVQGYSGAKSRSMLVSGGRHLMVAGSRPQDIAGMFVPPFSSRTVLGRSTTERLAAVVALVHSGAVKIKIDRRFPLVEAEAALALSQEGRMTGKIVLIPLAGAGGRQQPFARSRPACVVRGGRTHEVREDQLTPRCAAKRCSRAGGREAATIGRIVDQEVRRATLVKIPSGVWQREALRQQPERLDVGLRHLLRRSVLADDQRQHTGRALDRGRERVDVIVRVDVVRDLRSRQRVVDEVRDIARVILRGWHHDDVGRHPEPGLHRADRVDRSEVARGELGVARRRTVRLVAQTEQDPGIVREHLGQEPVHRQRRWRGPLALLPRVIRQDGRIGEDGDENVNSLVRQMANDVAHVLRVAGIVDQRAQLPAVAIVRSPRREQKAHERRVPVIDQLVGPDLEPAWIGWQGHARIARAGVVEVHAAPTEDAAVGVQHPVAGDDEPGRARGPRGDHGHGGRSARLLAGRVGCGRRARGEQAQTGQKCAEMRFFPGRASGAGRPPVLSHRGPPDHCGARAGTGSSSATPFSFRSHRCRNRSPHRRGPLLAGPLALVRSRA
jgi:NADPH:quinone reductase-like Zn-dependent oxidoreductase